MCQKKGLVEIKQQQKTMPNWSKRDLKSQLAGPKTELVNQ